MKKALLALSILFSSSVLSCPVSWEYPSEYDGWFTGFRFIVDGVEIGTAPAAARSAPCADIGLTPTDKKITIRAYREDQESVETLLEVNLLSPYDFEFPRP